MYYGYKFAKIIVASISVSFAGIQIFIFARHVDQPLSVAFILLNAFLLANSVLLLRSKGVADFLTNQAQNRSAKALILLKASRWALLLIVVIALIKDVMQFVG